ncbi:O-antigen ligase family protein [Parafilimonas sp.]|uniref:O-antigen ligase family protein n=1 Tax=Parafilimonas sp. TaxID=1969739 RepID=UPI0039E3DD62
MKLSVFAIFLLIMGLQHISNFLVALPILIMVPQVIKYILAPKYITFNQVISANKIFFLFAIIIIIGIIRTNKPDTPFENIVSQSLLILLLILLINGIAFYHLHKHRDWKKLVLNYILVPFALFSLLNLVLFFGNVKLPISGSEANEGYIADAVLLSKFGISIKRVVFPLATGINNYAIYVGGSLAISFSFLLYYPKDRYISGFCTGIFVMTLLFTDSRGALFYPILINLFLLLFRHSSKLGRQWQWLCWLVMFGPLVFYFLLPWLSNLSLFQTISRKSSDLATGNDRTLKWTLSFIEFYQVKFQHVFGWGMFGHYASGVSKFWSINSDRDTAEISLTPHSTLFSILFDYGYVGLLLYITVLWQTMHKIRKIWQYDRTVALPLLAFFIYNIISGITESLCGTYSMDYLFLLIIYLTVINVMHYYIVYGFNIKVKRSAKRIID